MTGLRIVETGDYDVAQVFDGDEYLGLVREIPRRFRVYGVRLGVDGRLVDMERDFATKDEAVAWLLDGADS
jgi:hypothetical protein